MLPAKRCRVRCPAPALASSRMSSSTGRASTLLAVTPFDVPGRRGRRSEIIVFAISLAQSVCASLRVWLPPASTGSFRWNTRAATSGAKVVGRLRRPDGLFASLLTFPQAATPETFRGGRYPLRFRMPHRRAGGGLHFFATSIRGRMSRRPAGFMAIHSPLRMAQIRMRPLQARLVGIPGRFLISRLDTRITRACPPPLFWWVRCRHSGCSGRLSRRPTSCFFSVHDPEPLVDIYRVRLERAEAIQTPKGHSKKNALSGWPLTAASRAISRAVAPAYHSSSIARPA